jgi:cerevisin
MASPHTAGLLAYLLGIYPSEHFNPIISEMNILSTLPIQQPLSSSFAYGIAHAMLPRWISELLTPARLTDTIMAPTPKPPLTLSPLELKTALIALASKGLLSDLPPNTANSLIFNNATT